MDILRYETLIIFLRGVVLGLLVLALAGIVWLNLPSSYVTVAVSEEVESYFPPSGLHQVEPGDTLWSIARTYYPDKDPREIVFELRKLNSLRESATIYPNQLLRLPMREERVR